MMQRERKTGTHAVRTFPAAVQAADAALATLIAAAGRAADPAGAWEQCWALFDEYVGLLQEVDGTREQIEALYGAAAGTS